MGCSQSKEEIEPAHNIYVPVHVKPAIEEKEYGDTPPPSDWVKPIEKRVKFAYFFPVLFPHLYS